MADSDGRSGRPWRTMRDLVWATYGPACWRCWQPIDRSYPPRHRLSYTVDHVIPRSLGGSSRDIRNLRPAHYTCNSRKGARVDVRPARMSRDW